MRAILRWFIRIALGIAFILITVLAVFSGLAGWRESVPAGRDGREGSYVQVEGRDMHYMSWGLEGGPVVILVHGTVSWAKTWQPVAERLAERGYRVLAPDFPPFGYSERPGDGDYSRAALARRIIGFADAVGVERFLLAGHSFAGGGTLEAAFSNPDRIAGLVLLDAALRLSTPSPEPPLGAWMRMPVLGDAITASTFTNPLTIGYGLRSFVHDPAIVSPDLVVVYREPLAVAGATQSTRLWYLSGLFGDERGSPSADREQYRRFTRPVLLIWGRQDTVTPLAQGEELAGLVPSAELVVLEDVNHIPQLEKPGEVADLIADFAGRVF
ncbi:MULTISPECIES: alpha/beta hydrolase [unclassified Ensifer]|uniref:alpha/beta fold hydrolase n=1 Tax=unclassified Ensifer TaxID=2633371 RepID=UPI000813CDFF|nr:MULTISPECIES: alpha/beta hydrolase [unclassified Ensifer]